MSPTRRSTEPDPDSSCCRRPLSAPHHFDLGYVRGAFKMKGHEILSQEANARAEQSAAERAARMRLSVRARAMREALDADSPWAQVLALPTLLPQLVATPATADQGGDVGAFRASWLIDGLR
ncbi:MAG: hypothetical protein GY711_24235 [bacterium]|nr:hypothetical protein [bacterium]